jgi:hypothetical protein
MFNVNVGIIRVELNIHSENWGFWSTLFPN